VNGVWLQGVLYQLARVPWQPELSARREERLKNLNALVAQARRHGIRVFLYLNEPRAMPAAFFQNRPEMAGVREGELTALCTSHPAVRQWMGDAVEHVFREVGGLAGVVGRRRLLTMPGIEPLVQRRGCRPAGLFQE
jgi:hypothetical protein